MNALSFQELTLWLHERRLMVPHQEFPEPPIATVWHIGYSAHKCTNCGKAFIAAVNVIEPLCGEKGCS